MEEIKVNNKLEYIYIALKKIIDNNDIEIAKLYYFELAANQLLLAVKKSEKLFSTFQLTDVEIDLDLTCNWQFIMSDIVEELNNILSIRSENYVFELIDNCLIYIKEGLSL